MAAKPNEKGRQLFQALAAGKSPDPIYLIHGEETFLVDEAVKAITRSVLPEGGDEFSRMTYEGSEAPGDDVRSSLDNLSLFGDRRVVHVRSIGAMPPKEAESILPYLERPAPDTFLILTDRLVDKRKAFFKKLLKHKTVTEICFTPLYERELPKWVQRRAQTKGLLLDRDGALLIVDLTGPSLTAMGSAIDRVALYVGKAGTAGEGDVKDVLEDVRSRSVFDLVKSLGRKDLSRSVRIAHRLMQQGVSGVGMVSIVARHFRQLGAFHDGHEQGLSDTDLARFVGVRHFVMHQLRDDGRRFDCARVGQVMQTIHATDLALKSSRVPDAIYIDRLILNICL